LVVAGLDYIYYFLEVFTLIRLSEVRDLAGVQGMLRWRGHLRRIYYYSALLLGIHYLVDLGEV